MEPITIKEITAKVKVRSSEDKKAHENILGTASVIFKCESGTYFSISGFTIWKSKYDSGLSKYNVTPPGKIGFQYVLFEAALKRLIITRIIEAYECALIPIIN